jgi:glyoxylase-like metal-dependent hydrolase (beta-lactamase superfamily II)
MVAMRRSRGSGVCGGWAHVCVAAAAVAGSSATFATSAAAQQPARPIETVAVAPGVTALVMHPDGTVLVVAGEAGMLVVDAGAPARAAAVDSAVAAHARGPVRWVVSTHYHEDHVGANPRFRAAGAALIAHPRMAVEAAKDTTIAALQWQRRAAPAEALPTRTFTDSLVLDLGGERVVVFHAPAAHTGGDALVHVLRADVIHTGDIVEFGAYPFVDRWAGGSIDGVIAATDAILARADANTRIVPGHGGVFARDDVVAYRAMLGELRARVQRAVDAGTTVDALVAERITAAYDDRHGGARHGERFVRLLYAELADGTAQRSSAHD